MIGLSVLEKTDANHYALQGALTVDTVMPIYQLGCEAIKHASHTEIDLQGVNASDSAGVALLIEWFRYAEQMHHKIYFSQLPVSMLAIAKVTGVISILPINTHHKSS